jgi:ADP-ribosylglycohydrolase
LIDAIQELPIRPDFPFVEPNDLSEIKSARPAAPAPDLGRRRTDRQLFNQIHGAWLGRCVGCLLGIPVEFWTRRRFYGLLQDSDNFPISRYLSSDLAEEIRKKYDVRDTAWIYDVAEASWINNIRHMPEDDDINYCVLALRLLEREGLDFTMESVAGRWLTDLPLLHTFTAERIAYANIANRVWPPRSATWRNPCREGIGAQIRGDFYGYINPGNPELAADMAWRDASISHVKNGIYGEMFVAAMLAAAGGGQQDAEGLLRSGLRQIPGKSRYAAAVEQVISWKNEGLSWAQAIDRIHNLYDETDEYDSLYVIPNAMVVSTGILYGNLDFEQSICIAVMGSFDKDCNGATVGSVLGMVHGASRLPGKWTKPLNDQVVSGIGGSGLISISSLAERSVAIAEKMNR